VPETLAGNKNVTGMTGMAGRRFGVRVKVLGVMAMTSLATFAALTTVYQTFFERHLFA
jgi:hypothetical protein